jgi:hypothetical protein
MPKPSPIEDVRDWAHAQAEQYRAGEDRPLGGYAAVMGVYTAGVGAAALMSRLLGRRAPVQISPWDLAQVTIATHRIARTVSKDPVTSPVRAPFTRYEGVSAAAELHEEVRSHNGLQHSVGELLSCPMCLAQWVATALTAGLVLSPRVTRLVAATFTAVAGADFLQYLYAYLQKATSS